jgi:hypothetical protein
MSVLEGVTRDLAAIGLRDPELAQSALAASALALAAAIDDPENSATSKSLCVKELRETLARLLAMAPAKAENDSLDELTARRSARRAAAQA